MMKTAGPNVVSWLNEPKELKNEEIADETYVV